MQQETHIEPEPSAQRRAPFEHTGGGWSYLWWGLGTVGAVFGMGWYFYGNPPAAPLRTPTPTPSPTANLYQQAVAEGGKTLIQSKKGRQWLMEASKVKWNDVGKKAHLNVVDWTLKSPKGANVVSVKAPGADVFVDDSKVKFQGMVDTYRFATGDHVRGLDMVWDGKRSLLTGDHGVRWTKGVTVVTADHMTASDRLEQIHLRGNVQITTLMNVTGKK